MLEYEGVSNNFKGDITVEEKKGLLVLALNRYRTRRNVELNLHSLEEKNE
jgi:hypothetical protein